ncbi:uncharacterized protein LOC135089737 isoform X3 [Scylla paramamosain]|uniref:uncharacterized protein LOC135089737 isoform X3 n=1 Tax=Scylla paramamosain TaxID=85552 RepID=UPI003082CD62
MHENVLIHGRMYISTKTPPYLLTVAVFMGIASGICLGKCINKTCLIIDEFCKNDRKGCIISGYCFAAIGSISLVAAITLQFIIMWAQKRNAEESVQQGVRTGHQDNYPIEAVAGEYSSTEPENPALVRFVVKEQAPPIASYPGEQGQQQRPPTSSS